MTDLQKLNDDVIKMSGGIDRINDKIEEIGKVLDRFLEKLDSTRKRLAKHEIRLTKLESRNWVSHAFFSIVGGVIVGTILFFILR